MTASRSQKRWRGTVEIGGITSKIRPAKSPELVPRGYLPPKDQLSQELLGHLRWMLQKDLLRQDMFLIGPPSPARRILSMTFCELLNREVEYIAVSQDTTESDLKQRREIVNRAAIFNDQAPVRAAIHGRVLVIDGLEKAERNVLPTLNNLLENREMTLDDGRFLMKAESYDALLKEGYSESDLKAQNVVRVHPDFRVIALGVPVPPYPGHTLDPPLRSRFQARNVQPLSPGSQLEVLRSMVPNVPLPTLERLVGIREAVNTIEAMHDSLSSPHQHHIPHFDNLSLAHSARVLSLFPGVDVANLIRRVFPLTKQIFGSSHRISNAQRLDHILNKYTSEQPKIHYLVSSIVQQLTSPPTAAVTFSRTGHSTDVDLILTVPCGTTALREQPPRGFVETPTHMQVLSNMIQDHAVPHSGDLCILGAKGSGKSELARLFAYRLGYVTELFSLFKDMTARDLVQRRATDMDGNTRWEDSPLVRATRYGHCVILDGVHRLESDSLSVLQRLVQDRELDLADGTKLLAQSKYDELKAAGNGVVSDRVSPIHPSFRIVAIADTDIGHTTVNASRESSSSWLNSNSISMFTFHSVPSLSMKEQGEIIHTLYPTLPQSITNILLHFAANLRTRLANTTSDQSNSQYNALSLSLRQLLRVCRRLNAFPTTSHQDLRPLLHETLLTSFLPSPCTDLVDELLDDCGAPIASRDGTPDLSNVDRIHQDRDSGRLSIGDVTYPIQSLPRNPELIPQPHYFDIPQHTTVMKAILQDMVAGQKHLLLIGNQGVGKNKIVDRLLQLLQQEREYIQLHRDTTVQTLTLVPTLRDGRILWEDSPLVRAATTGRTLIVDEADKAPLEVVCILKGLIEDGEMLLGSDKRLIDPTKVVIEDWDDPDKFLLVHPEFRMWVLANRPGFPFLGNNFFREIGDVFASHAIDNPDEASELALLCAYAPSVPPELLKRLCRAFAELREMVENGMITYPYSTREVVAVAKHLELFPNDGVSRVLENVLAFDVYDKSLREQLSNVFLRHGIPLSLSGESVTMKINLAQTTELPAFTPTETWSSDQSATKIDISSQVVHTPLKRHVIYFDPAATRTFSLQQHRFQEFTELLASFRVPMTSHRNQRAHSMIVFPDHSVHVLTTMPMTLHSFSDFEGTERSLKIVEVEGQYMNWETNPVVVNIPQKQEIGVFIPSTGVCFMINPCNHSTGHAECFTLPSGALDGRLDTMKRRHKNNPLAQWFTNSRNRFTWTAATDAANPGVVVRYQLGGGTIQLIDFALNQFYSINLRDVSLNGIAADEELIQIQALGQGKWVLQTSNKEKIYILDWHVSSQSFNLSRSTVALKSIHGTPASTKNSLVPSRSFTHESHLLVNPQAYLQRIQQENQEHHIESSIRPIDKQRWGMEKAWFVNDDLYVVNSTSDEHTVDLEVIDAENQTSKNIIVHSRSHTSADDSSPPRVVDSGVIHDGRHFLTLEDNGTVRIWQLDSKVLEQEVDLWKSMFGVDMSPDGIEMVVNGERVAGGTSTPRTGLDAPKHGKEDLNNDPHIGGNTWAGGTGGSDTAGLGGRGGPYRLDKGHPVHQVSQVKKDEVSAEMREKARKMAEEALATRLQEIDMSEKEWNTYQAYFARVEQESSQLRLILNNLESYAHERSWLKHQSSGDLDDAKLVDGIAGERLVFKRRGIRESPFQTLHQNQPKRMLFVMDVSGSMYRFNGQDGRLERVLETSLMIMESFAGYEHKLNYAIVGHSGDAPSIPFVDFGSPPVDRKERLKVLQRMVAHTQYCMSGDNTVESIDHAVRHVAEEEGDDYYVFVVSDANLERYGINPHQIGSKLTANPQVKAHAIFIASFADEAERIMKALPAGRGHVCLDTTELPRTFKKIFANAFEQ